MINPNITVDDITMAVAGRTKKLCRNCRHVGSGQKIEIGSFVCNLSWCNLDECYVRQDNACNDYGQKIKDEPVHCANCTFMSMDEDWCYFNKSVLLVSNSGVCTCENAKPRITMEHCKKCGWHYTGYMGCNGINGKIECPISKGARRDAIRDNNLNPKESDKPHIPVAPQGICHKCKFLNTDTMVCDMDNTLAIHHGIKYCSDFLLSTTPGEITLEIEDPCKKKANEFLDVLTEIAQEPPEKKKPSCLDCLYYKDTVLCSIANHFEICSDFRVV